MKAALLLLFLVSTTVNALKCHSCFNGVCFERNKITDGKVSGQLAIDRSRNIIYFHYSNKQSQDYTSAYNITHGKPYNLPSIAYTLGHAVDQYTGDVYMGGPLGLYRYSPVTNSTVTVLGLQNKRPFFLQYTNKLYFNEASTKGLHSFSGIRPTTVQGLDKYKIDDFVIDRLGDLYFKSNQTVYRFKMLSQTIDTISEEIYNLSTDKNGEVYFVQSVTRGIYKLDYQMNNIVEVGAFGRSTTLSFVFDRNNNIIYHDADDDTLYYLVPSYERCAVRTKRSGKHTKMEVVRLPDEVNEQE